MIDKLEVGVGYKLIDKDGFLKSHPTNSYILQNYFKGGILTVSYVDELGSGIHGNGTKLIFKSEYRYFKPVEINSAKMEYRVIRKASKHQVCDWRKGEKLYEDEYGTLVRNERRTKFYTDIVEWREVEVLDKTEPNLMEVFMDNIKGMSKAELSDLMIKIVDLTQINKDK